MPQAAAPTGSWRLRRAVPDDAGMLTALHLDVWDEAYTGLMPAAVLAARREDVPARIAARRASLDGADASEGREPTLLAETAEGLVGFVAIGRPRDDDPPAPVELMALYVRAAWWGSGVGPALLWAGLGGRAAYLWVLDGNDRAVAFYARHGFAADGVARDEMHGLVHRRMVRAQPSPGWPGGPAVSETSAG